MRPNNMIATAMATSAIVLASQMANAAAVEWIEQSANGLGTSLPPAGSGAAESFINTGFGQYAYDLNGRTLANAEVTQELGATELKLIKSRLFLNTDADLFKIQITDPSNFKAWTWGVTQVLSLFAADGTALGATRGGTAVTNTSNNVNYNGTPVDPLDPEILTGTALGLTTAGQYYIAVSQTNGTTIGVPRNSANEALFDFSTDGVKLPVSGLTDYTLSTDPFNAFTVNGGTGLLNSTSNSGTGAWINLSGANFSVVPEPTSMALLGLLAIPALQRRRTR